MAIQVNYTIRDADGDRTKMSYFLDDTVTDPTIPAIAIAEDVDVLIDGVIEKITITQNVDLTGATLKTAIGGQSDRYDGGRFIFSAPSGATARVTLPTFDKTTYVPAGSEGINIAHADVAAFLSGFLGAQTTSEFGGEVTALKEAYEVDGGKR